MIFENALTGSITAK